MLSSPAYPADLHSFPTRRSSDLRPAAVASEHTAGVCIVYHHDGAEVFRKVAQLRDRKSTRLNSSHVEISYAVFCLKKKKEQIGPRRPPSECRTWVPERCRTREPL